jgi:hypothetical protein
MCYRGKYKGQRWGDSEPISKICRGSDCSLKFENMKSELLVIVYKNDTVNGFPNLVHTARQARIFGFPIRDVDGNHGTVVL